MKGNVLHINSNCTGCGICSSVCNINSIIINRTLGGRYYPVVNKTCVLCGQCKRVCYKYIKESNQQSINNSRGYLAYTLNSSIRYKSSSGGMGKEITKFAIENDYEVCGVAYDYENNNVKHIIIDSVEGLDKIVGSKYIPSNTVDAFSKLDKNKKYMIIGTPCQIYGLRKLQELNKLHKECILVDFFCHGTPSLNLWDKYLDMIKRVHNIGEIKSVNFREKSTGWHNYNMVIEGTLNTYKCCFKDDMFSKIFLQNVDLNEPCYDCKLRFNQIYSDIRLGDFWGPKCDNDEKGTSIILTSTKLGKDVFKSLKNIYCEEITFEELTQSQYYKEIEIPKEREDIQNTLKTDQNLEDIYKKYLIPRARKAKVMRIVKLPFRVAKKVIKLIIK